MNLVLGGIAGISLLVGGIGIMNIAGNGARTDQEDQRPAGHRARPEPPSWRSS